MIKKSLIQMIKIAYYKYNFRALKKLTKKDQFSEIYHLSYPELIKIENILLPTHHEPTGP